MRIDSSGNLLVGKTAESGSTAGHFFSPTGYQRSARNGGIQILNRISTDGSMIDLQRDGSAVGSIGTANGYMEMGSSDTGLRFYTPSDAIIPANPSTNSARDAAIDLGISSQRFKDLYLSGGVYLGGTGAANKLDDYEEGTFTPTFTNATSYPTAVGRYTKIGNLVYVNLNIICGFNNTNSLAQKVGGFPFTVSTVVDLYPVGIIFPVRGFNQANVDIHAQGNRSDTSASLYSTTPSTGNNFTTVIANTFANIVEFEFSMTYRTDA
jgi:hypothetical protein